MSFAQKRNRFLQGKLRSVKQEVEEAREIVKTVKVEVEALFKEKYFPDEKLEKHENKKQKIVQPTPGTHEQAPNEELETPSSDTKHPSLRKMFKSIAKQTHPDIITDKSSYEKKEKKKLFDAARKALEEDDYDSLVDISEKLGLEAADPPEGYYEKIGEEINSLVKELTMLHSTLFWQWFMSTDSDEKDKILNEIFKRMQDYLRA